MAFVDQPAEDFVSCYRPLGFGNEITSTAAIENIVITVYWNGSAVATFRKRWISKTDLGGGSFEYRFEVDVQRIIQEQLAPMVGVKSSCFSAIADFPSFLSPPTDLSGEFYLEAMHEYRDPADNFLKASVGTDTSSTYNTGIVTRQHEETMSLEGTYWRNGSGSILFLTNAPAEQNIELTNNGWLSFISNEITDMRVELYNSSDVLVGFKIYTLGASGNLNRIINVGAGPENINNETGTVESGVVTIDADIAYYKIDVGTWSSPFWTSLSEQKQYNISTFKESRKARLHWLNRLGGADGYTFPCKKILTRGTKSRTAEKSLDWSLDSDDILSGTQHDPEDVGAFRLDIRSGQGLILETKLLQEDELSWLWEIAESPEVYLEQEGADYLLPVVVRDIGEFELADEERLGKALKLEVDYSNQIIRQRF